MEVKLRPALPGCLGIGLGMMSLGLIPWMIRNNDRNFFPASVDDEAVVTRTGKRILWSEFTKVRKVVIDRGMSKYTLEYHFDSPKGRVAFHRGRIANIEEVLQFVWAQIPAQMRPSAD
jgi:hypothetical protein